MTKNCTHSHDALHTFSDIFSGESCKYKVKRLIGKGSFGTVWQMVEAVTNKRVVGKFMDTNTMSETNRRFAFSEPENMKKCSHPNVIEFIERHEKNGRLLLVFEYADAGDLASQIKARAPDRYFKENEILIIVAQICLALNHLHNKMMMHRDLKSPNIFLTTCGLIKLGDFGFSRQYDESLSADVGSTFCGTPYYLAPELWTQSPYSNKADIWSLGIIMYELMCLRKPFSANSMLELFDNVFKGNFDPFPTCYSDQLVVLCTRMLSVEAKLRPSIKEIFDTSVMRAGGLECLLRRVPNLQRISNETKRAIVKDIEIILDERRAASSLDSNNDASTNDISDN